MEIEYKCGYKGYNGQFYDTKIEAELTFVEKERRDLTYSIESYLREAHLQIYSKHGSEYYSYNIREEELVRFIKQHSYFIVKYAKKFIELDEKEKEFKSKINNKSLITEEGFNPMYLKRLKKLLGI